MQNHKVSKDIILFDLDGTLTDPKVGITKSVQNALNTFGIHTDNLDVLCKFIGPPLKESFMRYYGFSEADALKAIEKYREYFKDTGIYENELYKGIDSMLLRLSTEGRQLIVATSKPTIFADRILEYFNISQYFSLVCGSELDGTRIRKGDVIKFALQEAGVQDFSRAIMVGDREHDAIGAKEARIDFIGVLYGYGSYKELENAGAAMIVETVEDLRDILCR